MTMPPRSRDTETRLIAALTDTARRNLSDATPLPPFRADSSPSRPERHTGAWAVALLAAAVVVAVVVALALPNRKHYSSMPPAEGPGTLVTLRAHDGGLSADELDRARRVIGARAAALGASHADVRIVGPDEIAAFLPGVAASKVGALGVVDAYQVRPFIIDWTLAPKWPMSVPSIPDPPVIDQWKSLGFAPPKDAAAYRALSHAQQNAVRAVITNWNCSDRPLDRADAPIVVCDPLANKYLLGTRILSSEDIQSAVVEPPGMMTKRVYLTISLSDAGRQRLKAYVAQHNDAVHPFDKANLVANMLDDVVAQVYGNADGSVSGRDGIGSPYTTQKVDAGLAANLTGGALPAPFDVVSIRSN